MRYLFETTRGATVYARENEAEFVKIIREASAVRQGEAAKNHKRQITKNEKRIAELDTLFKKTYEDFAAGRLNEKRFNQLSGGYESEQETLETQTADKFSLCEDFYRLKDEIRSVEVLRRGTENLMRDEPYMEQPKQWVS